MAQLLLVDDEIALVDGLADILESWSDIGIEYVHTAYNGFEALDILERHAVDIVITDIRMPGMDGLELIENARGKWPNTRCILLTGYSDFEYARHAIQNRVVDYLMKPVHFPELKQRVEQTIQDIRSRWEEIGSYQRAMNAMKEHLPASREKLLYDLLRGIPLSGRQLSAKLDLLELPFAFDDPYRLLLVRMKEEFAAFAAADLELLEYAAANIISEILRDSFELWHCKDDYGYHVFLLKPLDGAPSLDMAPAPALNNEFVKLAAEIQTKIRLYLKGGVSILIGPHGRFPEKLGAVYESAVSVLLQRIGSDRELILTLDDLRNAEDVRPLNELYEPPSLTQLLQVGRWDAAKQKLNRTFDHLQGRQCASQEHLLEVFFGIAQTFLFTSHRNGRLLADVCERDIVKTLHQHAFLSVNQLKEWTFRTLSQLEADVEREKQGSRSKLIRNVRRFMNDNLANDVSLQAIADHVYMHPSTLSKIYRMETGASISDFLFRLRMEKAAHMLLETGDKVQDIAASLGYQTTAYFIKVFREYFGVTPQEYRKQ